VDELDQAGVDLDRPEQERRLFLLPPTAHGLDEAEPEQTARRGQLRDHQLPRLRRAVHEQLEQPDVGVHPRGFVDEVAHQLAQPNAGLERDQHPEDPLLGRGQLERPPQLIERHRLSLRMRLGDPLIDPLLARADRSVEIREPLLALRRRRESALEQREHLAAGDECPRELILDARQDSLLPVRVDLALDELPDQRERVVEVLARGSVCSAHPQSAYNAGRVTDTPGKRAALRDALIARIGDPPFQVALALVTIAPLGALGELVADASLSPRQRTIGLLAIALVLADAPGTPAPADALEAIEDLEVAKYAIDSGLGAALTGVLHAAPRTASLAITRKLIGRRLLAADDYGPHVVQLLLDAGDRERAIEVCSASLARVLAARVGAETWAWVRLVADWSSDWPLISSVAATLASHPELSQALVELLETLPGIPASAARTVRSAIGWATTRGTDGAF
jgi:hypothetical protein